MQAHAAERAVEKIFDHPPDTRSLFLSLTSGKHLDLFPGQFISITIPLGDETRSRPYSIASDPEDRGPFEICFNRVAGGRGVAWLFERRVGDTLDFSGPFGTFTLDPAPDAELGFIAEGTAIAPIRPMLKRALASSSAREDPFDLCGTDREHILYAAELDALARTAPNFSYETVIAPAEQSTIACPSWRRRDGSPATTIARATFIFAASARASFDCATCCAAQATNAAPSTTSSGDARCYFANAFLSASADSSIASLPLSSASYIEKNPWIIPS